MTTPENRYIKPVSGNFADGFKFSFVTDGSVDGIAVLTETGEASEGGAGYYVLAGCVTEGLDCYGPYADQEEAYGAGDRITRWDGSDWHVIRLEENA